jgi:hypothetical protein
MLKITIVETIDGVDITTTKEFTETDHLALLNDLVSYTSWLFPANDAGGPAFQKVYQCRKRLIEPNLIKYLNDPNVNSEDEIINAAVAEPDYLNRLAREEGEENI